MRLNRVPNCCLITILATFCSSTWAQDEEESSSQSERTDYSNQVIEEIVTVGTRHRQRVATDTPVPVDVFSIEEIESINSSDLVDVLSTVVPSFNVTRQPISDGATFVRPTSLRGLDNHHTLVLINGKRRHRSALVQLFGFGSHGPDVGSFPSIGLQSVEVLRDGAAAQYGSDAIAGVINFNLKSDQSGGAVKTRVGGFSAGDGDEITVEGNVGVPIASQGFLNVSLQYSDTGQTSRSEAFDIPIGSSGQTPLEATENQQTIDGVTYYGPDAFTYTYSSNGDILQVLPSSDGIPDDLDTRYRDNYLQIGGPREFATPEQIWGQPRRDQLLTTFNASVSLGDALEIYGFGNLAQRDQAGGFFYRRAGVSQLLPLRLEDGSIYDPRTKLYPSGFTPFFSVKSKDTSGVVGLTNKTDEAFSFDVSLSYGQHELDYRLENTMNPSLGPSTPTEFDPGKLVSDELAANIDLRMPWNIGLQSPLNVAFGYEWREEGYAILAGNEPSWEVGPFAAPDPFNFEITQSEVDEDPNDDLTEIECRIPGLSVIGSLCPEGDPIHNVVPVGSNGFPGYSPQFASDVSRQSQAVYVDSELEIGEEWLFNAATRFEDFADFGSVSTAKIAMRYRLNDQVNVRSSLGTGFRAPTPGQISTTNVSTRINAQGFPVAEGIFPAEHDAAKIFGAQSLDSENSKSFTLGTAIQATDPLYITLDYYRIEVDSRIILSSQFEVGPQEIKQLMELGVPGANSIASVRFFTNDVDSMTQGVDLVANLKVNWLRADSTLEMAFNRNLSKLTRRGRFIDDESEHDFRHGSPKFRSVLSAAFDWDLWHLLVRGSIYGEYANAANSSLVEIQKFSPTFFMDVEVTRTLGDNLSLRLGSQNLLDSYPDKGEFEVCCGRIYRSDSLMSWQGRLLYGQLSYSWQ